MKRMLDQKTIDQLKALLSQVRVDEDENVVVASLVASEFFCDTVNMFDTGINPIFPLENNAGKVLAVNQDEDGLEAVSLPSGGTQLYKHSLMKDFSGIITEVLTVIDNNSEKLTYSNWNIRRANIISSQKDTYLVVSPPYCNANKLYTLGVEWFGSFGSLSQIAIEFDDDTVTSL